MDQRSTENPISDADLTLELIEEGILDTDITQDNAPMFGKRLLEYAIKSYEGAALEKPSRVITEHIKELKNYLSQAQENNYANLSRFLMSQSEIRKSRTTDGKEVALGNKFIQLAEALPKSA